MRIHIINKNYVNKRKEIFSEIIFVRSIILQHLLNLDIEYIMEAI